MYIVGIDREAALEVYFGMMSNGVGMECIEKGLALRTVRNLRTALEAVEASRSQ